MVDGSATELGKERDLGPFFSELGGGGGDLRGSVQYVNIKMAIPLIKSNFKVKIHITFIDLS